MRILYVTITAILVSIAILATWLFTSGDGPGTSVASPTRQTVRVSRGAVTPAASFDGFIQRFEMDAPVFVARVAPNALHEFVQRTSGAMVQLAGGPGPTTCATLTVPGRVGEARAPGATLRCVLPRGLAAVVGQPGQIAVSFRSRKRALVLPVEAVAGSVQHGQVLLVGRGGKASVVDVRLGASDGQEIEILGGLRVGDRVQEPAPDLPGFTTPSSN